MSYIYRENDESVKKLKNPCINSKKNGHFFVTIDEKTVTKSMAEIQPGFNGQIHLSLARIPRKPTFRVNGSAEAAIPSARKPISRIPSDARKDGRSPRSRFQQARLTRSSNQR